MPYIGCLGDKGRAKNFSKSLREKGLQVRVARPGVGTGESAAGAPFLRKDAPADSGERDPRRSGS